MDPHEPQVHVLRPGVVAEQLPQPILSRWRQAPVHQLGEQTKQLVGFGASVHHGWAANRFSMQCINCFLTLDSATFVAASDLPTPRATSPIGRPEP